MSITRIPCPHCQEPLVIEQEVVESVLSISTEAEIDREKKAPGERWFCQSCDRITSEDDKFCDNCGWDLSESFADLKVATLESARYDFKKDAEQVGESLSDLIKTIRKTWSDFTQD